MIHRAGFAASLLLVALASLSPSVLAEKKKGSKMDLITTVPDFASYGVKSIALLPVATFDRNPTTERSVADLWGQNFKGTGYRWVSATVTRDLLRSASGDSTVKVVTEQVLKSVRVDSLRAPLLCVRLHTSAVLSVRVDQWEQQSITLQSTETGVVTVEAQCYGGTTYSLYVDDEACDHSATFTGLDWGQGSGPAYLNAAGGTSTHTTVTGSVW